MGELGTLRKLCIKFERLWWGKYKCRDLDYGASTLGENVETLLLAKREKIGSKLCHVFARLIMKDYGGERGVCFKIGHFFSAHGIHYPSNISMKGKVEQLAENSVKKKEQFKELK